MQILNVFSCKNLNNKRNGNGYVIDDKNDENDIKKKIIWKKIITKRW